MKNEDLQLLAKLHASHISQHGQAYVDPGEASAYIEGAKSMLSQLMTTITEKHYTSVQHLRDTLQHKYGELL